MVNIQDEVRLLNAVRYIRSNPTLSFHHVSIKFDVPVEKLQDAFKSDVSTKGVKNV